MLVNINVTPRSQCWMYFSSKCLHLHRMASNSLWERHLSENTIFKTRLSDEIPPRMINKSKPRCLAVAPQQNWKLKSDFLKCLNRAGVGRVSGGGVLCKEIPHSEIPGSHSVWISSLGSGNEKERKRSASVQKPKWTSLDVMGKMSECEILSKWKKSI